MKKYLLFLLIPFFFACGREAKKQAADLQAYNDSLMTQTLQKDQAINDFIASINEIQGTLDTIKMKENIISVSASQGEELRVSAKEQIITDIQTIYSLMQKNRKTIESLQQKMKKSGMQVTELQKLVDRLNNDLVMKNAEIEELREKLAHMNIVIDEAKLKINDLTQTVESQSDKISNQTETIEKQTSELNTAYFIIGTTKELKEKGIIKGSLISKKELLDDFSKNSFTAIDIRKTTEIPILSKKAEVISTHPSSSYKFISADKKMIQSLKITDPKLFWSVTRYLVILSD